MKCISVTALLLSSLQAASGLAAMPPLQKPNIAEHLPLATKAMDYFDKSSDPFHAVQTSVDLLKQAGFEPLSDDATDESFLSQIKPNGKYFYTRNKSTLVAFTVGGQFDLLGGSSGCAIIGGHTDSPNLRVKPRSKRTSAGCIQLGVECYGGGLWHTWFDRDLGLSGRVLVRNGDKIEQKLVKINRALLRISSLAIHLESAEERKAFKYNKEEHLSPILALEVQKALTGDKKDDNEVTKDGWLEYQEPALLDVLASELDCEVADIVDFELNLFDVQKAAIGGAFSEFVHSARLDNLASCFMALQALLDHAEKGDLKADKDVSMIVLYDHEEVGSNSAVGAASPILNEAVERITEAFCASEKAAALNVCKRRSFVLSSDQAHAVHPNYSSKHEKSHQPKMNQGMVIKRNSNQRYATTPVTGVIMREIARKANLSPLQEFIVRQDCGCGSTIGPIISTHTGIRTIDMGCPQLSMHSIRETMGLCDISNGLNLFKAFFKHFRDVDSSIEQ